MTTTTPQTKTIAFFGASSGSGLAALKLTLAAGHTCIALCRVPSRLTSIIPPSSTPNLKIVTGNAHDLASVSACLEASPGRLVDTILSTLGGKFDSSKFTIDDAEVCRKGAATLLQALAELRARGLQGRPHVIEFSTTGLSRFGRDVPLLMVPLYHYMLKVPHEDKRIMEARVVESGEAFTIVRASFMSFSSGESGKKVRVGVEDPRTGVEVRAVGYFISREDAGRWIAENLILGREGRYVGKVASITY